MLRPIPYLAYELLRDRNEVFSSMLAYASVGLAGRTGPIAGQLVSGSYFETLGVSPILGRGVTSADDAPSRTPVAVISFGYWQSHFAAASTAIGQRISLNGIAFTIVGITPPS